MVVLMKHMLDFVEHGKMYIEEARVSRWTGVGCVKHVLGHFGKKGPSRSCTCACAPLRCQRMSSCNLGSKEIERQNHVCLSDFQSHSRRSSCLVATQDDGLDSGMVYEVEHPLQRYFEHFLKALTRANTVHNLDENFH